MENTTTNRKEKKNATAKNLFFQKSTRKTSFHWLFWKIYFLAAIVRSFVFVCVYSGLWMKVQLSCTQILLSVCACMGEWIMPRIARRKEMEMNARKKHIFLGRRSLRENNRNWWRRQRRRWWRYASTAHYSDKNNESFEFYRRCRNEKKKNKSKAKKSKSISENEWLPRALFEFLYHRRRFSIECTFYVCTKNDNVYYDLLRKVIIILYYNSKRQTYCFPLENAMPIYLLCLIKLCIITIKQ